MADILFTLGECNQNGKNYRFDYDNGVYKIFLVLEEDSNLLEEIKDSQEAYSKWNEIKRPEKTKKS